ncbi:MAG: adenosine kinase [Rikenellaceae bacterium]
MKIERVLGVGNALTDILVNLSDETLLEQFSLPKGGMTLLTAEQQSLISKSVEGLDKTLSLGGSAGNTIRAMAYLGSQVALMGKVGRDSTGDYFFEALQQRGITPYIYRGESDSGRCLSLITEDGERTMATYLGAALELCDEEYTNEVFNGYDTLYVEGYLVQNHSLISKLMNRAKSAGLNVAIDLASYNVVEENLDFLQELVSDYVDIIFANEDEARVFTSHSEPMDALYTLSQLCQVAVVKIGEKGALIKSGEQIIHTGILTEAKRVDTTGAGDYFAAGFLSAMCAGLPMQQCGTLGAVAAGRVIETVGTTLSSETWSDILAKYQLIKSGDYML